MREKVGAVLVIGGGVAGIQASLDLAESGFRVYLLERSPSIGGTMAQLDKTFPTNDCAMCILAPKLVAAGRHPNIRLVTNAELVDVKGEAGNFEVTIRRRARYVNPEKCKGCGVCAQYCPIEIPNEFDEKLGVRKAIYIPFPQAAPLIYTIDKEVCIECGLCEKVCLTGAVDRKQSDEVIKINVGSIILAPGFDEIDSRLKSEYGYGRYLNVITSIEFERILSASGPFGGIILRPSDGKIPKKIAFIQCVGSRDTQIGNEYCSAVCCMYSIKEAIIAKEHRPDIDSTIFFMDMRAYGKDFELYYLRAKEEHGVKFVRSRVSSIEEVPETQNLIVRYVDEHGDPKEEEFDIVVLSVGMRPPKDMERIAKTLGINLNGFGFCDTGTFNPLDTSRPGIFVCGAFSSPKDIPESVTQASGAAAKVMGVLASERWKLTTAKEYPPERDVSQEEPRIGVFICHCGINIGGIVNVPEVVEYAKTLPNVVYAEANLYTCSADTQKTIREKIIEHNLNRVVVASCTPRTHEPLFKETGREAGLNEYLFEMANIRDQCSWVHMHEPDAATEKSKDLVRAAVAKARLLRPLKKPQIPITPSALIIGGGISGMMAALNLADQGFEVHLVEKGSELGGHLRHIYYLFDERENPQKFLDETIAKVMKNKNIHVYLRAEILDVTGYVGNFRTLIKVDGETKEIDHGVIIVATGAEEYKPKEYLYGQDPRVITQRELEEKIAKNAIDIKNVKTIVMIQCVGSRTPERPNCSRICCGQAVKNALWIKKLNPGIEVYVLYKDVRTFGFYERYYHKALDLGVTFLRYDDEHKPQASLKGENLEVLAWDPELNSWVPLKADLLVLSAGMVPNPDNKRLSGMLKVPLTADGFFLEAHVKLRPVDFQADGIFLCGLAHGPKFIDESISQAHAAAARAATIISKKFYETEGIVARVNENLCVGCGLCVSICPLTAISKNEKGVASVNEVLCKGCGTCAASCPKKAITIEHFADEQLIMQGVALLRGIPT